MTGRVRSRRQRAAGVGALLLAGAASVACAGPRKAGPRPAAAGAAGTAAARGAAPARCTRDSVLVGYGAQSGCELTASVSSVAVDARMVRSAGGIAEVLRGRVPGLDVYTGPSGLTLRVRGAGGFQTSGEPLLVVDGMPVSGSIGGALAAIEPRDVARVDVLKDAGSAAVYGSRGANGVVLITTRRR